jgi:phosphoribosylanthranilate isomerase
MSLWVKICGNTSFEDALLAAEAGADAVGFVFAPSPRRISPAKVAEIVPRLPAMLEKIGVFVDAPFEDIESVVRSSRLTGVQLHFTTAPELPARLRNRFGPALTVLRVVHFGELTAVELAKIMQDPHVDAVLVDSRTALAAGGTGQAFDWVEARKTLFQTADLQKRMVAAGGLTPENVAQAIAALRPWGVDVVSGVEAAPGRKDPAKVRAFIDSARDADGD